MSDTTIDPDDGFEKHQETLLRRRWKVVNTTEEQWRHVYKILFPDDSEDLMPSPCKFAKRMIQAGMRVRNPMARGLPQEVQTTKTTEP